MRMPAQECILRIGGDVVGSGGRCGGDVGLGWIVGRWMKRKEEQKKERSILYKDGDCCLHEQLDIRSVMVIQDR